MDPLTKSYPSWTPYSFAMNKPLEGIDIDGLEFYSFNNLYIRMSVFYDAKIGTLKSTQIFRQWEKQSNPNFVIIPDAQSQAIADANETP